MAGGAFKAISHIILKAVPLDIAVLWVAAEGCAPRHSSTVSSCHTWWNRSLKNIKIIFGVLPASMHLWRCRPPEVIDGCELPCGCWELNPDPPEEQQVLLTTEPSLQRQLLTFLIYRDMLHLYCPYVDHLPLWLLSTWNVASAIEACTAQSKTHTCLTLESWYSFQVEKEKWKTSQFYSGSTLQS